MESFTTSVFPLLILLIFATYAKAQNCTSAEYRCNDGTCINAIKRCDGTIDCPDRSDEIGQNCGLLIAGIVYSPRRWAIVGEQMSITCRVRDDNAYPAMVKFQRRSSQDYKWHDIQQSLRVQETNTTANETIGLTRSATLHFKKIKLSDDGSIQPYLCCATNQPTGDCQKTRRIVVTVILQHSFPHATVTGISVHYGKKASLMCDVTYTGKAGTVDLVSTAWIRNNETVMNGTTTIEPYTIDFAGGKEGGKYACVAVINIGGSHYKYQLGTATLTVFVKFLEAPTAISVKVYPSTKEDLTLECPAEGYPLNIRWSQRNTENTTKIIQSDGIKYVARRPCPTCRYTLTINDIRVNDTGVYICSAYNSAGNGQHPFQVTVEAVAGPIGGSPSVATTHGLLIILGLVSAFRVFL